MAELYFQNLVDHRPDVAQRATYNNLQAFYQYLDRAKGYLERTRYELPWAPLGAVARLDPPRGARDPKAQREELRRILSERRLSARELKGPGIEILAADPNTCSAALSSLPKSDVEIEIRAGDSGTWVRALPVLLSNPEEARDAIREARPVWVELIEPDDEQAISIADAFFDDDTTELYEVTRGVRPQRDDYNQERRITVLDRDRERLALKLNRMPSRSAVCVRPNTRAITCEMAAIRALEDRPVDGHRPLIQLFENRDKVTWPRPRPLPASVDWQVLTDPSRPGTEEQRQFVESALRTPDFMLLEGPPGSGKTTAIVELILQMAARGQRVLLCASTHVAVDNVIDRLKDAKRPGGPVLVVRIGDEGRVTSEDVKGYCLNRMARTELDQMTAALARAKDRSPAQEHMLEALRADDGSKTLERILLDCAEVVCGTTIGILKHPDIQHLVYARTPWRPLFHALILDEASKTPFAEFLVPALLAERWIIVGDRRQLSPYVEEAWIETNVEASLPDNDAPRAEIGRALCDSFELARSGDLGSIVVASENARVRAVYAAQLAALFPEEPILTIDADSMPAPIVVNAARAVVGAPDALAEIEDALPLATRIFRAPEGSLRAAKRRHEARARKRGEAIHGRRRRDEESWAKQVSWRLVRDYELRLLPELLPTGGEDTGPSYAQEIEMLLPGPEAARHLNRLRDDVDRVRRVALPSILESLQVGFDPARAGAGHQWDNALARGLPGDALMDRIVSLRFQHRMHPDIAEFPHARLYGGELLDTPADMADKRRFSYPGYRSRAVWIDVRGKEGRPIRNEIEAREVIAELRRLAAWAAAERREIPWSVAVLTFYRAQERLLRDLLREATGARGQSRHFVLKDGDRPVLKIDLCTVDRYQGHEADIVILSFVRTETTGFLNSPNRLNVALTRARYQLVLIGDRTFLSRAKRKAPICALLADDFKRLQRVELRYGQ